MKRLAGHIENLRTTSHHEFGVYASFDLRAADGDATRCIVSGRAALIIRALQNGDAIEVVGAIEPVPATASRDVRYAPSLRVTDATRFAGVPLRREAALAD